MAFDALAFAARQRLDEAVRTGDRKRLADGPLHVVKAGFAIAVGHGIVEGILLQRRPAGRRRVERIKPAGQLHRGQQQVRQLGQRAIHPLEAAAGEQAVGGLEEGLELGAALAGDVLQVAEARQRPPREVGGAAVDLVGHRQHPL